MVSENSIATEKKSFHLGPLSTISSSVFYFESLHMKLLGYTFRIRIYHKIILNLQFTSPRFLSCEEYKQVPLLPSVYKY